MKNTINRIKIHNLTKSELAQLVCCILNLLNNYQLRSKDSYTNGWNDSRKSIINVLMLDEYYENYS